jgi:hypothetical protein
VAGASGVVGASRGIARGAASHDHAEVLRIDRACLAMGEGGRGVGTHADRRVSVAGVQDVRQVLRGVDPSLYDRFRGGQGLCAPRDVLAHFEADPVVVDVAARSHPLQRGVAVGAYVFEVVPKGHVLRVALCRRFDPRVVAQGGLAVAFAHLVYQALRCRPDAGEVARVGDQGRVGAGGIGRRIQRGQQGGGGAGEHCQGSR